MIYIDLFIGLAIGLFLFICTVKAYTMGIQHGKDMSKGIAPVINVNPVKTFSEFLEKREEKKQEEKKVDSWDGIYSYNPYEKGGE